MSGRVRLEGRKITFMARRFSHGGAERATALLCNYFAKRGLDVTALTTEPDEESCFLDEGIRVVHLQTGSVSAVGKARRILAIGGYIRRERPDVMITLAGPMRYLLPLKAYEHCDLILSECNWPPLLYSDADFQRVEELYTKAKRVVFQTPYARDCFCEEVRAKSAVIPNMVAGGLPEWQPDCTKRIVAIGRLDPQKNYELLLDAFAELNADDGRGFTLELYGAGSVNDSVAAQLVAKAQALGISDSVNFHGFSANVHEEIKDACMYVTSSDFEGLQNSLMEAMAMGIPCIATDCLGGGARMITDSGRRGLLVPRGDAPALAEAMRSVADSPRLRAELSSRGREIRQLYSIDSICEQWIRYIEEGE